MELRYSCPQCGADNREETGGRETILSCHRCDFAGMLPADWSRDDRVFRCPICGGEELYRRRDFNQRLAILAGLAGVALALFTKGISLVASGILILLLYLLARESLVCYRCRSSLRGHRRGREHRRFDSRVEERVLQAEGEEKERPNSRREVR
jgi:hypothetical protein